MNLEEKTTATREIFNGRIIRVREDDVVLPDGTPAKREIVEHNGGVAVAAIDEDGKMLMVKQFRKPFERVTLEIPAGKLEKGENPMECGMRELREETGYIADTLTHLGTIYPTPAYCEEKINIYFADNLKKSQQSLDDDEFLEVYRYSVDELYEMVIGGEICDAKTVCAILRVKLLYSEGRLNDGKK